MSSRKVAILLLAAAVVLALYLPSSQAALGDNLPGFGNGEWLNIGHRLIDNDGDEAVIERKAPPQTRPAPSNAAKGQVRLHYGEAAVVDKVSRQVNM